MTDASAHLAAVALAILAALLVVGRSLAGTGGTREMARTRWQYVWILFPVDYALLLRHPVRLETPSWYDALLRPLGLTLMLAGTLLVGWAYVTLGREWSGSISVRRGHRVVDRGPFALIRHPVYAGFLAGVAGAALALADPVVALGALVSVPLMYGRARAEERLLEDRLGDAYRDYRRRVPMFVPRLFG